MRVSATVLITLGCLLVTTLPASGTSDGSTVEWAITRDGKGDVREGTFPVADANCAYWTMANPHQMEAALAHLEGVDVHRDDGRRQDITLHERFFLVGLVESRYDRTVDGAARLEWTLTTGKQKRHDGWWEVRTTDDGRGVVTFRNVIEAKSPLHQPVFKRIQTKTMAAIVSDVQQVCSTR